MLPVGAVTLAVMFPDVACSVTAFTIEGEGEGGEDQIGEDYNFRPNARHVLRGPLYRLILLYSQIQPCGISASVRSSYYPS